MLRRRILILALLTIGFTSSGVALDINDSEAFQYSSGSGYDFEVYSNGTINAYSDLNMGPDQNITNYFDDKCGDFRAVRGIYPNGTWKCTDRILEEKTEYLNETLSAGNVANVSINMSDNNVDEIGDINSNGTDLNIGGDTDFEENNIENIRAIQDGPETDSVIFDEDNNLILPNGDLDLEGTTINDTSNLLNDGQLTLESDSTDADSGSLLLQTGGSDRLELLNDGQIKSYTDLNLTENRLYQANRIDFRNGSNTGYVDELSDSSLAFNSQGNVLRLQSANNQEISAESVLEMNENYVDGINAIRDGSDTNSLIFSENNNLRVPNGRLVMDDGPLDFSQGISGQEILYNSSVEDFQIRDANYDSNILQTGSTVQLRDPTDGEDALEIESTQTKVENQPLIFNSVNLDMNGSQIKNVDSLSNGTDRTIEIQGDGRVRLPEGNLRMNENSITNLSALYDNETDANFFEDTCSDGDIITGINANGSLDCRTTGEQITDIWVNETGDNMTGNLDMNDNDIIEVDEFRTNGTGDDEIAFRDSENTRDIARFNESGSVRIPSGDLNLKQTGDAGNDIVNVDELAGRDDLNLSGQGSGQGVAIQQGDGTTVLDAGTGNTDVEIPNGDLDVKDNNIDDIASIDGNGDEIQANDGINFNDNNVTDVKKVGFGDGNKIKTTDGRMCIGNRCS